jgi:inosine-uridine nucleoside N-ribohydrolase
MGVATEEHNIWTDPDAAAFVRSVNVGNETVPTVVIAGTTLVNPTARQVKKELEIYVSHFDEI